MIGRVEEWMKGICQKHDFRYYDHREYPYYSFCTCPDNCILYKQDNENKSEDKTEGDECILK